MSNNDSLQPTTSPARKTAIFRLAIAAILTAAILPYAAGYSLIASLLTGAPPPQIVAMLVIGLIAVILLNRNVGIRLSSPRNWQVVWGGTLGVWVVVTLVMVWMRVPPMEGWGWMFVAYSAATLWVWWLAWMFFPPIGRVARFAGLMILLAAAGWSLSTFTIEGLTGDTQVNFVWRRERSPTASLPIQQTDPDGAELPPLSLSSDADFAQYLGPHRTGMIEGPALERDWKKNPPKLLWKQAIGAGWGAFAIAGDLAVTQEQRPEREAVVGYDVRDGQQRWIHSDSIHFDTSMGGDGPRATPTIADGRVYAVGATGLLNCLDAATGKKIWSVDILGGRQSQNLVHGVCGSPLIVDDLVIVSPTADSTSLAAYDREDGALRWSSGTARTSYSSPMLVELSGTAQILLYDGSGVSSFDPQTGKTLWHHPWANDQGIHCAQPLVDTPKPGQIFVSCGYHGGSTLIEAACAADNRWTTRSLWDNHRVMQTKFTNAIAVDGQVYGLDNGILACVDAATGKQKWKAGRYGHGQILLVGKLILVLSEKGELALVEPNPDRFIELGKIPAIEGKTWNNLALAGNRLLVRNAQEAACFELPIAP